MGVKPLFVERMQKLLGENELKKYLDSLKTLPKNSIRCNTLKISSDKLKLRLEKKGWTVKSPFEKYPEIMVVESELEPGKLGRSLEHILGYYYVQELSSMLPVLVLNPKPNESVLDLAASPGSKTTQIAAKMENTGLFIANEVSLGRVRILASNTERCGNTNVVITRREGSHLCRQLKKEKIKFDKILIDAPCSGEGTLRTSPKTANMWNINTVKRLSKVQKSLTAYAFEILKPNGILVYSTCTHAPEENEEIVDFMLNKFEGEIETEKINLPVEVKCSKGIKSWQEKSYNKEVENSCRIYPHEFNSEGFFITKFRKIESETQ